MSMLAASMFTFVRPRAACDVFSSGGSVQFCFIQFINIEVSHLQIATNSLQWLTRNTPVKYEADPMNGSRDIRMTDSRTHTHSRTQTEIFSQCATGSRLSATPPLSTF